MQKEREKGQRGKGTQAMLGFLEFFFVPLCLCA